MKSLRRSIAMLTLSCVVSGCGDERPNNSVDGSMVSALDAATLNDAAIIEDATPRDQTTIDANLVDVAFDADVNDAEPLDAQRDAARPMDYRVVDDPNTLSSDEVFACDSTRQRTTPSRLWRLTSKQYRRLVSQVVGVRFSRLDTSNPFDGLSSGNQFTALADDFGMDAPTFDLLRQNARAISDQLTQPAGRLPACIHDPEVRASVECQRAVLDQVALELWRRPLAEDEAVRYLEMAERQSDELSPLDIIAVLVEAMALSPNAYFRAELGAEQADETGRHRLTDHEIADALSFGILDGPPDDILRLAASEGRLSAPDAIAAQVRRLLSAREERRAIPRFFQELLGYTKAVNVFKDPEVYPDLDIASIVRSADHTIDYLVRRGGDSLRRLLTSTVFVPDLPLSCETCFDAEELGAPGTPTRQDPTIRAGLLTHPAWLIAHSRNDETDPVGRGKFIREALLCQSVPDVPIDVIQQLPSPDEFETMRERLEQHSAPQCAGCHQLMDPLGLAFETYDHVGIMQGGPNSPIDTNAILVGSGDTDGPVADALELTRRLADSRAVQLCLTRAAFRFFMGRNEQLGDGCTLTDVQTQVDEAGGDFSQLLTALFASDTFLYRHPHVDRGDMP
ncbi:MAG: DUF1588 domain-containing protein [Bradymonadia bacterium]